ncbi:DUF3021 family protein [Hungatella effluvii]
MRYSVFGGILYFGIFFVIYFVIWLSQYWTIKKRVMQMNEKVQREGADR